YFGPAGKLGSLRFAVDPRSQEAPLVGRRPRLAFRRHLVEFDTIDRLPPFGSDGRIERAAQLIEPQFTFLRFRAVTLETVFRQQRLNLFFKRRQLRGLRRYGNADRTTDNGAQQSAKETKAGRHGRDAKAGEGRVRSNCYARQTHRFSRVTCDALTRVG